LSSIIFDNNTSYNVDISLVNKITNKLTNQNIELLLTTNKQIQEINFNTRGIDKPTDVLSFPYEKMFNVPLGSIVISVDFVLDNSKFYKHSFEDEFTLLFIHGILHLLGYDHEIDNGEHRKMEESIIKEYNLPKSLIVRTI